MSFAIFKVIDTAGGKIVATQVNNDNNLEFVTNLIDENQYYKFIFVKSSDLEIISGDEPKINIGFTYKDKL